MNVKLLTVVILTVLPLAIGAQSMPNDQVPLSYLKSVSPHTGRLGAAGGSGVLGNRTQGGVLGIDTVPNWSSYFYLPGVVPSASGDYPQYTWQYGMVGSSPYDSKEDKDRDDKTTWIGAPIVPVTLDLRNYDGSPRYLNGSRLILDPTLYVDPLLKSPVFSKTTFDSSQDPTQFNDAVQRAEFYGVASPDWHTLLKPRVVTKRTMVLIRGTYKFAVNSDGSLAYVLVDDQVFGSALFPPTPTDTTTPIGAAENSGDFTPQDIGTFYFVNTYLYSHTDGSCCILGYHSYDVEPGTKKNGWREKHYVMDYARWISPGLFRDSFEDITAVSHEMAEIFNDPFVNNATPVWLSPSGLCQNNLETGDVIEGLQDAAYGIPLNGRYYHPQNEAMLQWFASQTPSSAIHGAYSYPDTGVLKTASVSLESDCKTPVPF